MKDLTARIDALLATAAKPAKGKWRCAPGQFDIRNIKTKERVAVVSEVYMDRIERKSVANHIAAANPADLTALLLDCKAALAQLQSVVDAAKELHDSAHNGIVYAQEYNQLTKALSALKEPTP